MAIIKIRNAAIDLDAAEIPNLPATKITSGTLDNARISLDAAEIPNLDTAKITTGTLADARVPNLNASKITAGTIATARLGSGTANSSTFLRGDNTFASAGGANTPAFFAHSASEQALSNATYTQVVFGTEVLDTDNAFASNTFTVPSGKGGNYMIGANLEFSAGANYVNGWIVNIYVNGSEYYKHNNEYEANYPAKANAPINAVIPLTAGQTVKIYAYFSYTGSNGKIFHEVKTTNFYGFKLL